MSQTSLRIWIWRTSGQGDPQRNQHKLHSELRANFCPARKELFEAQFFDNILHLFARGRKVTANGSSVEQLLLHAKVPQAVAKVNRASAYRVFGVYISTSLH